MSNSPIFSVYFDILQPHDDIAVPGGNVAFSMAFPKSFEFLMARLESNSG